MSKNYILYMRTPSVIDGVFSFGGKMKQSKIEYINIDKLIPYVNNTRKHSEKQITQIASSIKEFGFNNPVLIDKDHGIIAGHGRVEAGRKLGLDKIPCVRLEHLSEGQKKAYIIADNKIAENATWDNDLLKVELESLKDLDIDLDILGFEDFEIDNILIEPEFEPIDQEEQPRLDEKKKVMCPECECEFTP